MRGVISAELQNGDSVESPFQIEYKLTAQKSVR